ncbi:MAG: RNA methyltransferase substrate-binding domain-containing protein, partial [Synergistaceae bacterium]|nr:RNA methyltransferase substrate-binding domain-containing protein [Synergistaceae bacterium]
MREEKTSVSEDICWGRNPVFSLLEESPERCMKVLTSKTVQPHIKARLQDLCKAANIVLLTVDPAALDKMTNKENHQGVVAYMAPMKLWDAEELIQLLPKAPEP